MSAENLVEKVGQQARACAAKLSNAPTNTKNQALIAIADAIDAQSDKLLSQNRLNVQRLAGYCGPVRPGWRYVGKRATTIGY